MRHRRTKLRVFLLGHGVLILLSLLYLFPLLWMVSSSLKTEGQLYSYDMNLAPNPARWANYPEAVTQIPFFRYVLNSLLVCSACTLGTLVSCSLAGYGLARIRWKGRTLVFGIILATMMLPFQATMLPLYLVFSRIGWVGTFLPLIVPSFFGNAFYIFLFRQFFRSIPDDLLDAARIDGCSEFGIYTRVILPLSKPVLAVVALFTFLNTWNDFIGPLLYLNNEQNYTVALGLQQFVGTYQSRWGLLMACSTVVTLPIIVLFFFTQRTFVQGITLTGLKG